jgi:hypothetical protein
MERSRGGRSCISSRDFLPIFPGAQRGLVDQSYAIDGLTSLATLRDEGVVDRRGKLEKRPRGYNVRTWLQVGIVPAFFWVLLWIGWSKQDWLRSCNVGHNLDA